MNSAKAHIIFNPVAGGGKAQKIYADLKDHFNARLGSDYSISITEFKGHATLLASEISKNNTPLIVCVGGDGTINEVVNGLFDSGILINPDIELGIVDCGTGCGFADSVGLPDTLSEQIDLIFNAQGQYVDLAECNYLDHNANKVNRIFVSECQIGIGSAVVSQLRPKHKKWGGKAAFGYVALKEVFKSRKYPLNVYYNGTLIREDLIGIVVGNGSSCGGGMKLTPEAKIDDGKLDLLVVHNMNIPELVRQFMKIYSGSHIKSDRFTYEQADIIKIDSEMTVKVEMDGELLGSLPVEIKVLPECLKVKCNI